MRFKIGWLFILKSSMQRFQMQAHRGTFGVALKRRPE